MFRFWADSSYQSYEYGELPVFSQELKDKGLAAMNRYDMLLNSIRYIKKRKR